MQVSYGGRAAELSRTDLWARKGTTPGKKTDSLAGVWEARKGKSLVLSGLASLLLSDSSLKSYLCDQPGLAVLCYRQ